MRFISMLVAIGSVLASSATCAQSAAPLPERTVYAQFGGGDGSSRALVVGVTLPWSQWQWKFAGGAVRGHWDAWLGAWTNYDLQNERFTVAVLGAGPSLRWRGQDGASPWFVEAGTSAMVSSRYLYNHDKRMGTRWNFASHVGGGWNFGKNRMQEVSLRLQHASNAGIKKPNPGINFVQLRYAHAF